MFANAATPGIHALPLVVKQDFGCTQQDETYAGRAKNNEQRQTQTKSRYAALGG